MNERERIQALLEAGKINKDEANLLLSALEEGDQAARQADQAISDAVGEPKLQEPTKSYPQGLRWVKVRLTAGELEAKLDPTLTTPAVDSQAEVRQNGLDLEVTPHTAGGNFLGGLLGGIGVGTVELRLPPGWGLEIDSKAAQIEVEGIRFLKGRVMAGNVELSRIEGLDLEVSAGNIEGDLLLKEGEHRLKVSMGNAELGILSGSSLKLGCNVSLGNLELHGFEGKGSSAQMGEGTARFDVSVRMGNLEVSKR